MRVPCLFGAALLATATISAPARAADPAQQRVDAYHQAIVAIATAGGVLAARTAKFEGVLRSYYDMPAIAALVVGADWAKASAADRGAATAALTKHSALQLAKNLKGFGGTAITDPVVSARGADKLVRATLGGDALIYRLRGGKIIDVLSGGVSQLAVQRSDFASTVATGGAAALAKRLAAVDAKALAGG